LARPKHVQADPGHHRREPTTEILNAIDIGARKADPCFLGRVIRFPLGTQYPRGDRPHLSAVLLELLDQALVFRADDSHPVLSHILLRSSVILTTNRIAGV